MPLHNFIEPKWHRRDDPGELRIALESCTHVYERIDSVKLPLQRPYSGPYMVLERHSKYFCIQQRGIPDNVSRDRLKPAFQVDSVLSPEDEALRFSSHGRPIRTPKRFQNTSTLFSKSTTCL
ncbi:hypothetical protein TCAL_14470 [Tigriopus californicus]|uniref:Uncharacterized protein n=1 Tax=Tigriopus californicus TaxID=6832 RepID=A0A553PTS9_TIGCA|nr:hypothetical protein TCAL_14470 [Tigriopus californicus]